jgi:hypothetical protein
MPSKGRRTDWKTPVSTADSLGFVRLVDDNSKLRITVTANKRTFCFEWKEVCAYRNTLEEYRLPWEVENSARTTSGSTSFVADSAWIAELRKHNDLIDINHPNIKHYVISNGSYSTEVISNEDPQITEVATGQN